MITTDRAAANAANAQLSTGPRTEEGKARSSRNAIKHGLTSRQLFIPAGEEERFAELHEGLYEQLAPEGALEMGLFNMIAHASWNLERLRAIEAHFLAGDLDALLDERTGKALDRLQRYVSANQRTYFKALNELRTVQANRLHRRELEGHDDPLPELVPVAAVEKRMLKRDAEAQVAEWTAIENYINAPVPRLRNEPIVAGAQARAAAGTGPRV